MLQTVFIAGHASYSSDGQTLGPCKNINFVFGTNGSGKTTISRVIADPQAYPACRLTWVDGHSIECLVYNSDFVERNFSSRLKGIFTLGEESAETIANIEAAKDKQHEHEEDIAKLEATLRGVEGSTGKLGDLDKLRRAFEDDCWQIKTRHDGHFREVFEGIRGARAKFCDRVLAERATNHSALCELSDLKERAGSVFQQGLVRITPFALPSFTDIVELAGTPILAKRVVGKEDVRVSALITRLGNSDWVKQGLGFLDHSGKVCPFCQQQLLSDLAQQLNEYFDESYAADLAAIDWLEAAYEASGSAVLRRLEQFIASGSSHFAAAELKTEVDQLGQLIELNKGRIARKKNEPSAIVALEDVAELAQAITERLNAANQKILNHNRLVDNIAAERAKLAAQTWRFLLHESETMITRYLGEKENLDKAVAGITKAIEARKKQLVVVIGEIAALEASITSVQPTVNEINGILSSFGFTSFKLATAGERGRQYKLIRSDGSDALKTLSEGEKSFISFLYFYHLIRGSVSESGVTGDRIVVFDDPVSSLDSDVLFVVSSLIKQVLNDACEGRGQVKQVFVLTHNIYFHKEVSFDPKRGAECRAHETFWIVRKKDDASLVEQYNHNPIKTSYEMLWAEVRDASRSNLTIQNTLRRILESYFKLLGNMDRDEIIAKFEGRDKQICASLFSWVNDGSHAAHDDLYVSADEGTVDRYLEVFKLIFDKTGHKSHLEMMIGAVPVSNGVGIDGNGNAAAVA